MQRRMQLPWHCFLFMLHCLKWSLNTSKILNREVFFYIFNVLLFCKLHVDNCALGISLMVMSREEHCFVCLQRRNICITWYTMLESWCVHSIKQRMGLKSNSKSTIFVSHHIFICSTLKTVVPGYVIKDSAWYAFNFGNLIVHMNVHVPSLKIHTCIIVLLVHRFYL